MKNALVLGVNGQDGAYLAKLLLQKGYIVFGTSRDVQGSSLANLVRLGIRDMVKLISMAPEDFRSVFMAIRYSNPDEVYFLAGQSSAGLSFEQPAETIQSFTLGTLNVLEACRMFDKPIRQYHAGSSECFGDTQGHSASESTRFKPSSPYAVAKASSFWMVDNYRQVYGLFACTGILFNHESSLRPQRFVTQKIIQAAKRIAAGSHESLELGRLDIVRDWGWAPDYVEAMWLMLQKNHPEDYIIATGKSYSLQDFVETAFAKVGLNWANHIHQSAQFFRPSDIGVSSADPTKAKVQLGWSAKVNMHGVVANMIDDVL